MKLEVKRTYRGDKYTIGHLYIDNKYFCDTLEDPDRGLISDMPLSEINKIKVKGDTCIPYGEYVVSLNVRSPKYSNFAKYPYARICSGYMPRVVGVKGFEGILIHPGNSQKDTEGCLLVGRNTVKGRVMNSQETWKNLYNKLKEANGEITIKYTKG